MTDLYQLLDLSDDAGTDAIEESLTERERLWAQLARDPDPAVQVRAGRVPADLVHARETLLDPDLRIAYDVWRAQTYWRSSAT